MKTLRRALFVFGYLGFHLSAGFAPAQNPPDSVPTLVFDASVKEYKAKALETNAPFVFNLTNVWTNEIVIRGVRTSCGCTVASLPANPWHLASGSNGQVHAAINLIGKSGTIEKTLTFDTSVGERVATVRVVILPPEQAGPPPAPLSEADRKKAMALAGADARAIFQGDCAECHVKPAQGRMGAELYAAACGICHESPHRASMVPDLRTVQQPGGFEYWKRTVRNGKPNTMMPGFALSQGGPLNDSQISSLTEYLSRTFPLPVPPTNAAASGQKPSVQ